MAADMALEPEPLNPCCAEIKKRYQKLEEKRNALRQAVKLLENEMNRLVNENQNLKKAYEEERARAGREKEAIEKESVIRHQLEKEIHDLKAELSFCQKSGSPRCEDDDESRLIRILEAEGEVESLKELLEEEKKRSNSEKKKAEVEKKKAAEAWKLVKVEKSKVEEVKKHAEIVRKKADEYMFCLEKLKMEANEAREKLFAEISKADDANKKVEAEKQKINRERGRADLERTKAEEHRRLMEVERKKAMDEKYRADKLSQSLEKEKQRSEELHRKVEEVLSLGRDIRGCSCFGDERDNGGTNIKTADVKLLREQLKLKKKQVKHAKRMNKLEKVENMFIRKELHLLKQDFMQMSCRFNVLYDFLPCSMEGTESLAKNGESPELWGCDSWNNLLDSQPCNFNPQSDFSLPEMRYRKSLNRPCSARECPPLPLSRGSCTRPTSGINSELEPPVGGSVRIKSQSSAICSNATSFSDSKFMGSQGKDVFFSTASTEVAEKNSNQRSSILRRSGGVGKTRLTENIGVVAGNNNRASVQRNVTNACMNSSTVSVMDQLSNSRRKKRRLQNALESIKWVYSEDSQVHLKIVEKLSELKYLLNRKVNIPSGSENSGISEYLHNRKGFCAENHKDRSKKSCKHCSDKMLCKRQKPDAQYFNQNAIQKQAEKYEAEDSRIPCFLPEMAKPFQMNENAVCRGEPSNAVSSKRADLISFEKLIHGDYMKLLDLDSDNERRYKAAIEMPLSPTLPEIKSASLKLCVQDDSHFLVKGTSESFDTESNSLPFHTVDVIDLEISSNFEKQKALHFQELSLNDNSVLSHSSEEVRIDGAIVTDSDFKQHDMLCNIEHNSSFHRNDSNMDVELTHNGSNSGDSVQKASEALPIVELKEHREFKHLVHGLLGPNAISDSKVSKESVSGGSDKSLFSGSTNCSFSKCTLHSEQLCENWNIHNSIPKIHNLSKVVVNVPSGTHGLTHATVTTSSENIEGKGEKHDGAVVSQSGEILDKISEAEKSEQNGNFLVSECVTKMESFKSTPVSTIRKISDVCGDSAGLELEKIPKYFVVFSNMNDCSKTRISQYSKTVISQGCMDTQVLRSIAMEPELLPKEKAAVFFSLLLCNISGALTANSRCTRSGEFLLSSVSFAEKINKVLSNGEARWLILEICQLNILVELIEDFLINRKVLLYTDRLLEPLSACFSSQEFHQLNGSELCVFTRDATVDQIIASCVIFASISATVGHIGTVLEFSYRILQMCRNDISWILLALHVFAFVCGGKFFNLDDHRFLVDALRLVVSLVEHENECEHSASSCIPSTQHMPIFPPCDQCPFAMDELCMDNFVCSLLDELQFYALADNTNHLDEKKSIASVGTSQLCSDRNGGTVSKTKVSGLKIQCVGSCSIYKFGKLAADRSECFSESSFCYFTDIISLVELVGCYMRWEWTYNKIVSCIVNMLEFCKSEEFLAALFVLVGQLARFGIDDGGYQQTGVSELRCSLSRILDASITEKRSMPTQFSAVGALLNLLPFNFEEIVDGHPELSQDASEYGYVLQVKKWFSHLSVEQQAISFDLFR